jgi:hypothetical protein
VPSLVSDQYNKYPSIKTKREFQGDRRLQQIDKVATLQYVSFIIVQVRHVSSTLSKSTINVDWSGGNASKARDGRREEEEDDAAEKTSHIPHRSAWRRRAKSSHHRRVGA